MLRSRIIPRIAFGAALLYCSGAVELVRAQPAPACRWSDARTSLALAQRRQAEDDQPAAMHAYVEATRSTLGCRTIASAMFSADAFARAGAAYGRGDYRNVREELIAERTTAIASAAAVVRSVHVIVSNIDFAHRTFTAIDRALESLNAV